MRTRLRWAWTRRRWKAFQRAQRGNTADKVLVWYWNGRQLAAGAAAERFSRKAREGGESVSGRAWRWLAGELEVGQPDAICVQEVVGGLRELRAVRSWFRQRGYEARTSMGAGGSRSSDGAPISTSNGSVWAVRRESGRICGHRLLAVRTYAVEVRWRGDPGRVRLVGLHGLHAERRAWGEDDYDRPPVHSFREQLRAAEEYAPELMVGDLNKVTCVNMRESGYALSVADRALRETAGWRCVCCDGAGVQASVGRMVPMTFDGVSVPGTRRWSVGPVVQCGHGPECTCGVTLRYSTLDQAMVGRGAAWAWRLDSCRFARGRVDDGGWGDLSDHALVGFVGTRAQQLQPGQQRQGRLPISAHPRTRVQHRILAAYRRQLSAVQDDAVLGAGGVADVMRSLRATAEYAGTSATTLCAEQLMEAGQAAVAEVSAATPGATQAGRTCGARWSHNLWRARLRELLRLHKEGVDVRTVEGGVLFHRATGLQRIRDRGAQTAEAASQRLIRRCRGAVRRAGRHVGRYAEGDDRRLRQMAQTSIEKQEAAEAQMKRVRDALYERSSGGKMDEVFPGDDVSQQSVPAHDPRFRDVLGEVGAGVVQGLDEGCLPDSYAEWCRHFGAAYDEIPSMDGGDWVLARELTFRVFLRCLYAMPREKAVGEGGLSIALLVAAGREVQFQFFAALKSDMLAVLEGEGKRMSAAWKKVLYALLKKPPPNDPRCVSGRREIALMPHDLKLFMQMLKVVAYDRVANRVIPAQMGWSAGFGCTDPSLTLQMVVQQARRAKQRLYILYLDLATFFPKVQRKLATVGEILLGLPFDVARLALLIYGGYRGDPAVVQCQLDSEVGLGSPFGNWMGWLMGCVLSPDKSRILLNSIAVAIQAKVRGVRLWGFGRVGGPTRSEAAQAWRAVEQLMFGDDWAGISGNAQEVALAWAMWCEWASMSGAKIGIKGFKKTVLTGVCYSEAGVAKSVPDLGLMLPDGARVPLLPHDEAYKHLGRWTCANGDDSRAWLELKKLFKVALARLRKMRVRKTTRRDFDMVADWLLGGVAGFYLQTMYITFEQAEWVETQYRSIFKLKFEVDRSTPNVVFYLSKDSSLEGFRRREHVWTVGLAALWTCVSKAMADVADTPQRAAARSGTAMAMHAWGVRGDPMRADTSYLVEALETSLRAAKGRWLGDAWLLADTLFGGVAREGDEEDRLGALRVQRWGRFRLAGELPQDDPWRADAPHWAMPSSPRLFAPVSEGGLEIAPEPLLLQAQVVSLGQLCKWGVEGPAFCGSLAELRVRAPRLGVGKQAEAAFQRVLASVCDVLDLSPVRPERVERAAEGVEMGVSVADYCQPLCEGVAPTWVGVRAPRAGSDAAPVGRSDLGRAKLEAATAAMGRAKLNLARRAGLSAMYDAEYAANGALLVSEAERDRYAAQLCESYGPPVAAPAEWHAGRRDDVRQGAGVHVVVVADAVRSLQRSGGEGGFLRGQGEEGSSVGADGYMVGWEERLDEYMAMYVFDEEGWPVHGVGGERLSEGDIAALPALLQLECRARVALGEEVTIINDLSISKRSDLGTFINLAAQWAAHVEGCAMQAKFQPHVAYSMDASHTVARDANGTVMRDGDGRPEQVDGVAVVRHDGVVISGLMDIHEGGNNYLGEMVAQAVAGHASAQLRADIERLSGGAQRPLRIATVFDATSPVAAWLRFRRVHDRVKQGYYGAELLDSWWQWVEQQELWLGLWQTSHVGEPRNEWADVEAGKAASLDAARLDVRRAEPSYFSMCPSRPSRKWSTWARARGGRVVEARLRARSVQSVHFEEGCVPIGELSSAAESALLGVRTARGYLADAQRRRHPAVWDRIQREGCAFGCVRACGVPALGTWSHYAYFCSGEALASLRTAWCRQVGDAEGELDAGDVPNEQYRLAREVLEGDAAAAFLRGECDFVPSGGNAWKVRCLRFLQEFAGGIIRGPSGESTAAAGRRNAARLVATAGGELMARARAQEKPLAVTVGELARWLTWARRALRGWRDVVVGGGPARVAACRAVREGRKAVMRLVKRADSGRAAKVAQAARLVAACAVELAEVDECYPPLGRDAVAAWAVVRGVRRWRVRVARRLLRAGVVLREPRSVVFRRLMRAGLGGFQLVERTVLTLEARADAVETIGMGLAGDRAMSGLAFAALGGLVALRGWLAWRRGPGQVQLQAAAMRRWAVEVDGLRWQRSGSLRPVGGVLLDNERLADALGTSRVFTTAQWRTFGVRGLHRLHYVWAQGACYTPCFTTSLSGRPLEPVGRRVQLPRHPAVRPGAPSITHKVAVRMRREAAGMQAMPDGRWRVAQLLGARVVKPGGGVVVMVRWAGPAGKHPDSEVRLANLSVDMRREARAMLPGRQRAGRGDAAAPRRSARVRAESERVVGVRRSARLAAGPSDGMAAGPGGGGESSSESEGEGGEGDGAGEALGDGRCWGSGAAAFYEVEQILERRTGAAGLEYRVSWGGIDPSTGSAWESSWVLASQLSPSLRWQLQGRRVRRAPQARGGVGSRAGNRRAEVAAAKRRIEVEERQRAAASEARAARREQRGGHVVGASAGGKRGECEGGEAGMSRRPRRGEGGP